MTKYTIDSCSYRQLIPLMQAQNALVSLQSTVVCVVLKCSFLVWRCQHKVKTPSDFDATSSLKSTWCVPAFALLVSDWTVFYPIGSHWIASLLFCIVKFTFVALLAVEYSISNHKKIDFAKLLPVWILLNFIHNASMWCRTKTNAVQ